MGFLWSPKRLSKSMVLPHHWFSRSSHLIRSLHHDPILHPFFSSPIRKMHKIQARSPPLRRLHSSSRSFTWSPYIDPSHKDLSLLIGLAYRGTSSIWLLVLLNSSCHHGFFPTGITPVTQATGFLPVFTMGISACIPCFGVTIFLFR